MDTPPFDPSDYSYVIGIGLYFTSNEWYRVLILLIDFGTTFSGCCYAFSKDGNDEIIDITKWLAQYIKL
jgi:hypothetical protein